MAQFKVLWFMLPILCLTTEGALCCFCEYFSSFQWSFGASTNISLARDVSFYVRTYQDHRCQQKEAEWKIATANGEIDVYTTKLQGDSHDHEESSENGIELYTWCKYNYCEAQLIISPTHMRYNEALITCNFSLPECGSFNVTDTSMLNIQGLLEAPTNVRVEVVGVESVVLSWSPPFTLDGVPILHYTIYIISHGLSEHRNTTETYITLGRPCASTSYQITAWNEVGEGEAAIYCESRVPEPLQSQQGENGGCTNSVVIGLAVALGGTVVTAVVALICIVFVTRRKKNVAETSTFLESAQTYPQTNTLTQQQTQRATIPSNAGAHKLTQRANNPASEAEYKPPSSIRSYVNIQVQIPTAELPAEEHVYDMVEGRSAGKLSAVGHPEDIETISNTAYSQSRRRAMSN